MDANALFWNIYVELNSDTKAELVTKSLLWDTKAELNVDTKAELNLNTKADLNGY